MAFETLKFWHCRTITIEKTEAIEVGQSSIKIRPRSFASQVRFANWDRLSRSNLLGNTLSWERELQPHFGQIKGIIFKSLYPAFLF